MHPAAAFIKAKYFKTRAKEWGREEGFAGGRPYYHGNQESLLQTTKDPRTAPSFPSPQMPNGCLADEPSAMKISPRVSKVVL